MDNTYNSIDLSKWTKVGEGGNGSVYTCPQQPDIILKVSHFKQTDDATENLTDEFTRSKAVFDLGHIQTLNWHERMFLSLLVRSLI